MLAGMGYKQEHGGTFDSRLSKIRTEYLTSLQRTQLELPTYILPMALIHFSPPKEDTPYEEQIELSQSALYSEVPLYHLL